MFDVFVIFSTFCAMLKYFSSHLEFRHDEVCGCQGRAGFEHADAVPLAESLSLGESDFIWIATR